MSENFESVRRRAVEIALMEAKQDTREVGADNRGERIDLYLQNANALKKGTDPTVAGLGWCGMFIYWCYSQAALQAGKVLPFNPEKLWRGSHLKKWVMLFPEKIVQTFPVLPGDIYIINNNHIGMVIETAYNSNVIKTIDGNQSSMEKGSNSVRKKTRNIGEIDMFIRI